MRRGPFTAVQDEDGYFSCRFGYTPELIEFIKEAAPRHQRWWDSSSRCWTIGPDYINTILERARYMGFSVRVVRTERDDDTDDNDAPPPRRPASSGDASLDFVNLLSFDALHAGYKKQCLLIHPDRPGGGDVEAMKRLNMLWDQLKKKFGK